MKDLKLLILITMDTQKTAAICGGVTFPFFNSGLKVKCCTELDIQTFLD